VGVLAMTSAPSCARRRETRTCSALPGVLGLLVRPQPFHQAGRAAARAQVPGEQREEATQPGAGDLLVAVRHPRQQGQLDGHGTRVAGHLTGSRSLGVAGAPPHARQLLALGQTREPLRSSTGWNL
jgi:hypothetical protein